MDLKIAICDNKEEIMHIKNLIIANKEMDIDTTIEEFESSKELMKRIKKEGWAFDIVFLDVDLEDEILGMEVAYLIKMMYADTLLIYLSDHDNYYKELVQSEPFRFITKPISLKSFNKSFGLAVKKIETNRNIIYYEYAQGKVVSRINLNDVLYFITSFRQVIAVFKNGSKLGFYKRLYDVEKEIEKLCSFYIRVNKNSLVNYNFIKEQHSNSLKLVNEEEIIISKDYKKNLEKIHTDKLETIIK